MGTLSWRGGPGRGQRPLLLGLQVREAVGSVRGKRLASGPRGGGNPWSVTHCETPLNVIDPQNLEGSTPERIIQRKGMPSEKDGSWPAPSHELERVPTGESPVCPSRLLGGFTGVLTDSGLPKEASKGFALPLEAGVYLRSLGPAPLL